MEELDLKGLFNVFWKGKVKIILIVLIMIVLGVIYTTSFVTEKYTASTTLVLATSGNKSQAEGDAQAEESITATEISVNSKLVSTYSELVKSKKILREVIKNLGIDVKEEELRANVNVSSVKNTELIKISVTNLSATYPQKIANEIANVFIQKVDEIYNIDNVHIVDEAEIPSGPSNIHHAKDVAIFAGIGLIIAVFYVLIANILDTTIKSTDEIEQVFKVPVLASIPIYNPENERKGKGR